MKHGDIRDGQDYAWNPSNGRPEAGDSANSRVRILDRRKDYVRVQRDTGKVNERGRKIVENVVVRWDSDEARAKRGTLERFMLGQPVNDDGSERTGAARHVLVDTRNVPCDWRRHVAFAGLKAATRERERQEREAAKAQRDLVTTMLGAAGIDATPRTYPRNEWTMDEGQALALVRLLQHQREVARVALEDRSVLAARVVALEAEVASVMADAREAVANAMQGADDA